MKIIATCIGNRKQVNWKGKVITTGIFKFPIKEPIFLDTKEVRGDNICDKESHGGSDQAVYGYSLEHYDYWKNKYPNLDW